MRLLILVLLIGVGSSVFVQKLIWRESERSKMLKAGTWRDFKRQLDERRALAMAQNGTVGEKVYDFWDGEYLAKILVGTPGQVLTVVMDTGSPDTWIITTACTAEQCRKKHQFEPTNSTTYKPTSEEFHAGYGTGATDGYWGNETITLGDVNADNVLVLPDSSMAFSVKLDPFMLRHTEIDGIFGLFLAPAQYVYDPVLVSAWKRGLLEVPTFTTFYEKRGEQDGAPGGQITFGGVDTKNCGPVLAYQPLVSNIFWQVQMDVLKIGDTEVVRDHSIVFDTGTSDIVTASRLGLPIMKALNATRNDEDNEYYVDCDLKTSIDLTIGGKIYSIEPTNYILDHKANGKCELAIEIDDRFDGGSFPELLIGDPMMRQFCLVHDIQNRQIGFANPITKP